LAILLTLGQLRNSSSTL